MAHSVVPATDPLLEAKVVAMVDLVGLYSSRPKTRCWLSVWLVRLWNTGPEPRRCSSRPLTAQFGRVELPPSGNTTWPGTPVRTASSTKPPQPLTLRS